jgi:UDP-glucose 4-epimerase
VKVLITGGAGFVGSHLAEELLSRGQQVTVYDDLSTGTLSNVAHLQEHSGFRCHRGSILEPSDLAGLIEEADLIYHLAAAVGVRYVLEHPVAALETNVHGTQNVLRLAQQLGEKKVILASSSEVYGKACQVPFREDADGVLGPTSVSRWGYACSKALDEFLALAYHQEKRLPVVVLRFFNTVGPRQTGRYGMVLPRFITQALAGDPITVYGDGQQTRSFTHVKDVVRAAADIAMAPAAEGQVFNVGSEGEITINDLAQLVRRVLSSRSEITHVPFSQVYGPQFEETRTRVPDISKIQRYIDYHPNTDLGAIVREVADDMLRQKGGPDAAS